MDGNRTHPGRLNSAPQTFLKTAGPASMTVHQGPREFDRQLAHSMIIHPRSQSSAVLAVILAVTSPR